jgi:hypothetical protein
MNTQDIELSIAELDLVRGGLNPQPLPPAHPGGGEDHRHPTFRGE